MKLEIFGWVLVGGVIGVLIANAFEGWRVRRKLRRIEHKRVNREPPPGYGLGG